MFSDRSQGWFAAATAGLFRVAMLSLALASGAAFAQASLAPALDAPGSATATRTAGATDADPATALARYVAKPDSTFSWEVRTHYRASGADAIELVMQSQTWQGVPWKHQVVLIKPRGLAKPDSAAFGQRRPLERMAAQRPCVSSSS